jgi:hypothetical protein
VEQQASCCKVDGCGYERYAGKKVVGKASLYGTAKDLSTDARVVSAADM